MQETGLGLYYGESFNTFAELGAALRNRFTNKERKAKRKERKAERERQKRAAEENEQNKILMKAPEIRDDEDFDEDEILPDAKSSDAK